MTLTADSFPTGIEDFEELITSRMVYVDKTYELSSLLKPDNAVTLLLRPR